jgi:hypothetical protein
MAGGSRRARPVASVGLPFPPYSGNATKEQNAFRVDPSQVASPEVMMIHSAASAMCCSSSSRMSAVILNMRTT